MDSRTSRLFPPAERFYVGCSEDDRREIDRILRNLCADPWVNGETISTLSLPPVTMNVYGDGRFWIVFKVEQYDTLCVFNIGHATSTGRSSSRRRSAAAPAEAFFFGCAVGSTQC